MDDREKGHSRLLIEDRVDLWWTLLMGLSSCLRSIEKI